MDRLGKTSVLNPCFQLLTGEHDRIEKFRFIKMLGRNRMTVSCLKDVCIIIRNRRLCRNSKQMPLFFRRITGLFEKFPLCGRKGIF